MGDGDDSGGDVPGEAHEGAGGHENTHPEQVQVVATAFLPGRPAHFNLTDKDAAIG